MCTAGSPGAVCRRNLRLRAENATLLAGARHMLPPTVLGLHFRVGASREPAALRARQAPGHVRMDALPLQGRWDA